MHICDIILKKLKKNDNLIIKHHEDEPYLQIIVERHTKDKIYAQSRLTSLTQLNNMLYPDFLIEEHLVRIFRDIEQMQKNN